MVDDVLLAHLPLYVRRLALFWCHDRLFVRGITLLHRLRDHVFTQLRQGPCGVE